MRSAFFVSFVILCTTIFSLPLQLLPGVGESDCMDCGDLLKFKKTFPLADALANNTDFTVVEKAGYQKLLFSCDGVYASKEESKTVWPPLTLSTLRASDPDFFLNLGLRQKNFIIEDFYVNDAEEKTNQGRGYTWTKEDIEARARKPCTCGQYETTLNKPHCETTLNKYADFIKDAHGLVIGSENPWAEAALFRHGAARVTTIEYMPIETTHPNHITLTPAQAAAQFLAKTLQRPHFVFTFSSLEHDGLGRYGDPLNAFGDLQSIAKIHCMLPVHGLLFLGLPVGHDAVSFNAHRIYGFNRLSVILSMGFRLVDVLFGGKKFKLQASNSYFVQPVMVLQKLPTSHHH